MGISEIDSISKEPSKAEIKKALFTHWDTLPIIEEHEEETFKKMAQPIRHSIIRILADGIDDTHPETSKITKRHALSASEIMDILESKYKEKVGEIKKSNLYFHLNLLEEIGAIKVVDQIPTGKRFTTYYGRSAKVFYIKPSDDPEAKDKMEKEINHYSPLRSEDVKKLMYRMNPETSKEEIDEAIEKADGINKYSDKLFKAWVMEYQKFTEGLDINFINLHGFLSILNRYNEETVSGLVKVSKYLGIDKLDL